MSAKVLGISGSPVKNSNTDRLVNSILLATGLEWEFVWDAGSAKRPDVAKIGGLQSQGAKSEAVVTYCDPLTILRRRINSESEVIRLSQGVNYKAKPTPSFENTHGDNQEIRR